MISQGWTGQPFFYGLGGTGGAGQNSKKIVNSSAGRVAKYFLQMVILKKIVFVPWVLCQFYPASALQFLAFPRGGVGLGWWFMGPGKAIPQ